VEWPLSATLLNDRYLPFSAGHSFEVVDAASGAVMPRAVDLLRFPQQW